MNDSSPLIELLRRIKRVAGRLFRKYVLEPIDARRRGPILETFFLSDGGEVVPNADIVFTIVIPTLDGSRTLADTIRTCLSQDDRNLRVIVSGNASGASTAEVVALFSDSRLSYVNSGRHLGMAEHWEFSISHADDGYLTVLGDADGLLPGAIRAARRLLGKSEAKVLAWQKCEYQGQDHVNPALRDRLQIPLGLDVSKQKTSDVVRDVIGFRASCSRLPGFRNAFVSTDLIKAWRSNNDGVFFGRAAPDPYSAFAVASEVDEFIFCKRPLSISRVNGRNDVDEAVDRNDEQVRSFAPEPETPGFSIVELGVLDAFLKVKKATERFNSDVVDNEMLIRSAVGSAFGEGIPADLRKEQLEALRVFAESNGIRQTFEDAHAREVRLVATRVPSRPGYNPPHSIVLDASMFGARDVHAATLRVGEVLDLMTKDGDLFQKLLKRRCPDLAVVLFARAKGQPLRLHLGCGGVSLDGYVNVDFPQSQHNVMTVRPDVFCDITEIDLPVESVEEVRLHHVFEHLNRAVALASVIKWHGWLRVGGKLHIETPDFEASARDFLSADGIRAKMRAIRHLEGDQADSWAYHVGQWFPERFEHTFKQLGFDQTEIRREASGHTPPLRNVVAIGTKTVSKSAKEQYEAGCELLKDTMVADEEAPTWDVWKKQLAGVLGAEMLPVPTRFHPRHDDPEPARS